jgi:hypothetical protein
MNWKGEELSPLRPSDGMGDFMRFTSEDRDDAGHASALEGFTQPPATEPASRRLSRIGIFRRLSDHNVLRLL